MSFARINYLQSIATELEENPTQNTHHLTVIRDQRWIEYNEFAIRMRSKKKRRKKCKKEGAKKQPAAFGLLAESDLN